MRASVSDPARHLAVTRCPLPAGVYHVPGMYGTLVPCQNDAVAGYTAVCLAALWPVAGKGGAWVRCQVAAKGVPGIGIVPLYPVPREPDGLPRV